MSKGKIFSLGGENVFDDIRKALVKRGWVEKNDCENFDFKWTLRARDLNERNLLPHQVVNHFMNSKVMTTKAGLLHKLRELPWHQPLLPLDGFFPRSYDLSDEDDTKAFYIDFKWSCAEAILKHVIADGGVTPEGVPSYAVVEMALTVCHMRIHYLNFLASDSPIPTDSENPVKKPAWNCHRSSWSRPVAPWISTDSAEEDVEEAAPLPDWTTEQWAMLLLCPCFGSKAIQDKQISEALGVTPVPSPRGGSPISRERVSSSKGRIDSGRLISAYRARGSSQHTYHVDSTRGQGGSINMSVDGIRFVRQQRPPSATKTLPRPPKTACPISPPERTSLSYGSRTRRHVEKHDPAGMESPTVSSIKPPPQALPISLKEKVRFSSLPFCGRCLLRQVQDVPP